jgi:sensor c-di-GMP phosphodiesterase-like protein
VSTRPAAALASERRIVAAIFVALAPLLLMLLLGAALSWLDMNAQLQSGARALIAYADASLVRLDQRLERSARLATGACSAQVIAEAVAAPSIGVPVRDEGLVREASVYCSTAGGPPTPLLSLGAPAIRPGYTVWTRPPSPGRPGAIAAAWLRPDLSGAFGVLSAREMVDSLQGIDFNGRGALSLEAGPTLLAESSQVLSQLPPVRAVEASPRFPITAVATADPLWAVDLFVERLPYLLLIGGAFSILCLWLYLRLFTRPATLEEELWAALRNGDFTVHYQPIIDLQALRCVGGEALLRWNHPTRGVVTPGAFLKLAEDSGLLVPLTHWLMRRVREDLEPLFGSIGDLRVAINVAGSQLAREPLVSEVEEIFGDSVVSPARLILESTESDLAREPDERVRSAIRELHALGCVMAIDDVGAGAGSERTLAGYAPRILKIDRPLVRSIAAANLHLPMLDAIIDFGLRINATLLAEGIERREEFLYLRQHGVHLAQGYYFARPMPLEAFERYVRTGVVDQTPAASRTS